jgi:hypothetical protein
VYGFDTGLGYYEYPSNLSDYGVYNDFCALPTNLGTLASTAFPSNLTDNSYL